MTYQTQLIRIEQVILTCIVGIIFTSVVSSCSSKSDSSQEVNIDPYGGWREIKLTKTGFFHAEHDGNRWWFITPEGHAFLSFGINHYHEGWWTQEYNLDYWLESFGALRPGDVKWNEGFRKVANTDMKRLGINTLGWHTDAPMLTDKPKGAVVPYLRSYKPIILDHYRHPKEEAFMDVFAPEFEELCEETAQKVAGPYINDTMLLGYCMSDCPIFTDQDISAMEGSTSWSRILRNLGADAPGKKAYIQLIRERYPDISIFNNAYSTGFASWDDLLKAEDWRPNQTPENPEEQADNLAFTLACVDRYYSVAEAAIRKVDPNHLFLGDKLNGNTDNLEQIVEVAARYVDVIVYQFYGSLSEQKSLLDRVVPKADLPFVNGDIGFSVPYEMMPAPHGPHARDQAERAAWLMESCIGCFARPEFIGWHMCGIIDTWKTMPGKEQAQHQGLMTIKGEFYPEMEEAVKEISSELYQIAAGIEN